VQAAVRAAQASCQAGIIELVQARSALTLAIINAYSDVLHSQESLKIQARRASAFRSLVDENSARAELGLLSPAEVAQAETSLFTAEAALRTAQSQLDAAQAQYRSVVGVEPSELAPLPTVENLDLPLERMPIEDVLSRAPSVRWAALTAEAAGYRVSEAKSQWAPRASIVSSYSSGTVASPFGATILDDRGAKVGLEITIPFFSGGAITSHVRQAVAEEAAARYEEQSRRRAITATLRTLASERQSLVATVEMLRRRAVAARTSEEGFREEREAGLRSGLEVILADENVAAADQALVDNQFSIFRNVMQVLDNTGDLPAIFGGYTAVMSARDLRACDAKWDPFQLLPSAIDRSLQSKDGR